MEQRFAKFDRMTALKKMSSRKLTQTEMVN